MTFNWWSIWLLAVVGIAGKAVKDWREEDDHAVTLILIGIFAVILGLAALAIWAWS
jgi:hypothetical protein